jgi:multicomponent Na+:H+ antiporter subunit G
MGSHTWTTVADVAAGAFLLGGSFLAFAAGVGVLRFPDLLARMHAATKPQTLGLVLVLAGLALRIRSTPAVWALVLVAIFQMVTAPVAAHLIGRAGYRTGKVSSDALIVDELTADVHRAEQERLDRAEPPDPDGAER